LNENQLRHFTTYLRLLADDLDFLARLDEMKRSGREYEQVRRALVERNGSLDVTDKNGHRHIARRLTRIFVSPRLQIVSPVLHSFQLPIIADPKRSASALNRPASCRRHLNNPKTSKRQRRS